MNMGIGFIEIFLVSLIVLVFFGSREVPRFIREAARLLAKLRRYGDKVKRELDEVTSSLDVTKPTPPSEPSVQIRKASLRTRLLAARAAIPEEVRLEKSAEICRHLMDTEEFNKARAVMAYISMKNEVETRPLLEEILRKGKRLVVPYCVTDSQTLGIGEIRSLETDLVDGAHQTREPRIELRDGFFRSDIGLIICPGVGFDIYGARLGRGRGYYDNFLRELKGRIPVIGLAFGCQVQKESLPFSYTDIVMDQIFTENGCVLPARQEIEQEETE